MATAEYTYQGSPPASFEAEVAVLGAILLDSFAFVQSASAGLKPDDFSLESHRRIYSSMLELSEAGVAIDIITVSELLERKKQLESVGGRAYLAGLTEGLPHRPNIEHYVKIVCDKSLLRGVINAAEGAIAQARNQEDEALDVLSGLEGALFQLSDNRTGNDFVGIKQIVKDSFGSIDALYERGQRVTGLETHYVDLDEMTSGLQPSDLIILAARPSMGKTSLAMNIAENAAVNDKKVVAMFSLEMSRESLLQRLLCSQAKVDAHKLRGGFLVREDRDKLVSALGRLADSPIFIDDTPGINVSEMRAKARRLKHQQGEKLDLIIVDYLQLMSGTPMAGGRRYENRTQEVSAISRGLKMLAKDLKVPVMALSQLSRAPETRGNGDHRPQLSDLRESGSIEQDADVVAFIFREEVYDKDDPSLKGVAELIISKQRNGPTGMVKLAFLKQSTRFENYAGAQEQEEGY